MRLLHGTVQHYDWGSTDDIPTVLGRPPDGRPWAEYWLGTHPVAPSTVDDGMPLANVVGELPFLLKLLAAAQPLSLQTHPTSEQARRGYAREEHAGLALDAPTRIYRDPHAKPELLCALTPFDVLCGFRPVPATLVLLDRLGVTELAASVRDHGLAATVDALYRRRLDPAPMVIACRADASPEARLVAELDDAYPGEPSVVITLLLNRFTLQPGEAVFLDAGNLHAYLHGLGVEVMASSDNVVRGGLTSKHVDVDELLHVLDPTPLPDPVVHPVELDPGCFSYPAATTAFQLFRLELRNGTMRHRADGREIVLCTSGSLGPIGAGDAVVLADAEVLELAGTGTAFVACER
jgi:mannose-6-phosphate isomerase